MRTSWSRHPALIAVASLAVLTGCSSSSDSGSDSGTSQDAASSSAVPVVASTNVYGDIAKEIGAGRVKVTSIVSDPSQDPHSYEANTRNQLALSKAKVVIENGGGYDDFVDRMLKGGNNASPEVINAVKTSGRTAPEGEELNEHVWYDFPSVAKLADRIAAGLAKADPDHASTFTKNAKAFKAKLKPLEAKERQIKSDHEGEAVAITEPVPLYLTEASGLENKTPEAFSEAIEEGDDVSPKTLQSTLALFSGKKVKALVYNEQTTGPQTKKVEGAAKKAGIPVVSVTETLPEGKGYIAWMTANVDALASALDQ
ncbi:metal ABC transporter solute-binding protein, Zn/Mn family [Streptomyces sp. WMMB 322]|uniref:metal ABC transporter solute-binding protein, Zn/Mn family n=1 Tax=Streptomyces sp. WMMB 322 TaxID=1286821 RepID=UPI0006E2369D|nr:zinc ABC transporter substrate-binding protein [Streptomyces sp. WMMB 322]SCK30377.1 zinc/manganese transport system substrate-binding protein [Streptomyces sp. WMMB 322]